MSAPEPSRRTAGIVAAVLGLLTVGTATALVLKRKAASSTVTPPPGTAPGQVTGVTITPTGPSSAVVTWQPPISGSSTPITYLAQHTDKNGNAVTTPMGSSPAQVTTQQTSITLDGLTPGADLDLTVQACLTGSDGSMSTTCGTPSAVASVTMPAPTVPQVTGVQITATSSTTATVSWSPVQVPAGAQSVSYTVTHTDASGSPTGTPMGSSPATVTTTGTSIQLSGLTPGAELHADVMACAT